MPENGWRVQALRTRKGMASTPTGCSEQELLPAGSRGPGARPALHVFLLQESQPVSLTVTSNCDLPAPPFLKMQYDYLRMFA